MLLLGVLGAGVPRSFSGSLIDSIVRNGVLNISQVKRDWTLEYRFGTGDTWKPCVEQAQENHVSPYSHFNASLEVYKWERRNAGNSGTVKLPSARCGSTSSPDLWTIKPAAVIGVAMADYLYSL